MFKTLKIFSPNIVSEDQLNESWCMNIETKNISDPRVPLLDKRNNNKAVLKIVPLYTNKKQQYYSFAIPIKKDWSQVDLSQEIDNLKLKFSINVVGAKYSTINILFTSVIDENKTEVQSNKINLKKVVSEINEWIDISIPLNVFVENNLKFSTKTMRLFQVLGSEKPIVLLSNIRIESI